MWFELLNVIGDALAIQLWFKTAVCVSQTLTQNYEHFKDTQQNKQSDNVLVGRQP